MPPYYEQMAVTDILVNDAVVRVTSPTSTLIVGGGIFAVIATLVITAPLQTKRRQKCESGHAEK